MQNVRSHRPEMIGEFLGTFVLVLLGCGSVAVAVLFGAHPGLLQIGLIWGIAVGLAIYLTRHLSDAHLNPAVTFAMVVGGRMSSRKLPGYWAAQLAGAIAAAVLLLVLFGPSISAYEAAQGITRGAPGSEHTAMIFGEFYPNPDTKAVVSMPLAVCAEAFGTFFLVLMIFALTESSNVGRPGDDMVPIFIGLVVTSMVCLLAPLTQGGINPARDFGPRLVAVLGGWGKAALPDSHGGFFWVYILAPLVGGSLAALFFTRFLESTFGHLREEDEREAAE